MRKILYSFCLLAIFLFIGYSKTNVDAATSTMDLKIHYLDVGQADSIFIQLPNGKNMLIDAGTNAAGPTVVNDISSAGVTTLDYVIGTHPHEDHIGGLDNVINTFNIGKVYLPNVTVTTQTYLDVIDAINAKGLTITQAKAGVVLFDTQYNNKTLKAVMVAPNSDSYTALNNYSAVIRLTYGDRSFLFTGDAQALSENEMIASGANLQADVLKVGHHGSDTSTTQAFLDAVKPRIAVISLGVDNTYGFPKQDILDRLTANNVDIYRTDLESTIIVSSDGYDISVYTTNDGQTINYPADGQTQTNNSVVINEVLPAPQSAYQQEWVELYNTSSQTVDLSGYSVDDITSGGASPIAIAQGTTIAPHGYYVVYTNNVFNNSGDDVNLINTNGTVVDSFSYGSTGYDESWYRTTDGGSWNTTTTTAPTPNATNSPDTTQPIMINEVLPAPKTTYSQEWVELYNPNSIDINLTGYTIDDIANGGSSPLSIPVGTIIPAHGFYVQYTNSVFNNSGDDVRLIKPDGSVIDQFSYGSTGYDVSWYRTTDGGSWSTATTSSPTPNATNSPTTNQPLVINEVLPAPKSLYSQEWVEIYNPNSVAIDLSGYTIDDIANGGHAPMALSQGTTIAAHGYYVLYCSSVFNNSGDDVRLIQPDGTVVDQFSYGSTGYDVSWYRITDGGTWSTTTTDTPTPGSAN